MEQETAAFFRAVRAAYQRRAAQFERIKVVDAGQALADVQAQVTQVVKHFLVECGI